MDPVVSTKRASGTREHLPFFSKLYLFLFVTATRIPWCRFEFGTVSVSCPETRSVPGALGDKFRNQGEDGGCEGVRGTHPA